MTATMPDVEAPVPSRYAQPVEVVAADLGVDPVVGPSQGEVGRRLATVGPNRLREEQPPPGWRVFLDQFRNGLFLILLAAAALAGVVGDMKDGAVIGVVLVLNATIGFVQERKAERSLEALKRMLVSVATVRRDGATVTVAADELVPGDVVLLEAGSRVPADGRLAAAHDVEVDESSLTGESHPVAKVTGPLSGVTPLAERANMLHANTVVTRGRAEILTVATGMDTEIGHVAQLLSSTPAPATPLQVQLDSVGRRLALVGIAAVSIYSAVALARGESFEDVLLRGVALAVAAVPEGLPAVLALVLALGVRRMARRGAIVRHLASVETLGSATVVCTDKTGTLTRNEMTVRQLSVGDPHNPAPAVNDTRRLLSAFVLCNDASLTDTGPVGDPMEVALLVAATEQDVPPRRLGPPRPELVRSPSTRPASSWRPCTGRLTVPRCWSRAHPTYFYRAASRSLWTATRCRWTGLAVTPCTRPSRRWPAAAFGCSPQPNGACPPRATPTTTS